MAYEKYTIQQFLNAKFNNDYSELPEDELSIVYAEYVDTAGLFDSEEFELVSKINFLNSRINSIKIGIKLQRLFLDNFDVPYKPDFVRFKNMGHSIYWNDSKDDFIKQLEKVDLREKKYISQLEKAMKELVEKRLKKNKNEQTVEQSRASFIRTIISLGKLGYTIDKQKSTMEDFAYMIKQQTEEMHNQSTNNAS